MAVKCWWGASVKMPYGMEEEWSCKANAQVAVKISQESLSAWSDQPIEAGYVPVCGTHRKEVAMEIEDWIDIGEYVTQEKARRYERQRRRETA